MLPLALAPALALALTRCEPRGGGLRGGALAAVVLLVLFLVLPWSGLGLGLGLLLWLGLGVRARLGLALTLARFLLCGAWRLGYLDKCIQRRRGRVRVGGNEAGVTVQG